MPSPSKPARARAEQVPQARLEDPERPHPLVRRDLGERPLAQPAASERDLALPRHLRGPPLDERGHALGEHLVGRPRPGEQLAREAEIDERPEPGHLARGLGERGPPLVVVRGQRQRELVERADLPPRGEGLGPARREGAPLGADHPDHRRGEARLRRPLEERGGLAIAPLHVLEADQPAAAVGPAFEPPAELAVREVPPALAIERAGAEVGALGAEHEAERLERGPVGGGLVRRELARERRLEPAEQGVRLEPAPEPEAAAEQRREPVRGGREGAVEPHPIAAGRGQRAPERVERRGPLGANEVDQPRLPALSRAA